MQTDKMQNCRQDANLRQFQVKRLQGGVETRVEDEEGHDL